MYCWSVDLQILFNTDKCKTLHFGYNNVNNEYTLGNEIIKSCDKERDLGVIISRTLKSSSQCVATAKSANRILGMISRTFVNKDSKTMLKLYQSLARNLSYSQRLNRLNITTLETRRLSGDLILVFKIFKGLDNVQHSDLFTMADTELKGHEHKVYKPQVHLDIGKYFFSVRIVDAWNSLPAALLRCDTVENFEINFNF